MNTALDDTSVTLVRLTRAATGFHRLVDSLLLEVRNAMGVPVPRASSDVINPAQVAIELEFSGMREQLQAAFFPEYQQLYGRLLLEHIGSEHVPSLLEALQTEVVQTYLSKLPEIEAGLQTFVSALFEEMRQAGHEEWAYSGSSERVQRP